MAINQAKYFKRKGKIDGFPFWSIVDYYSVKDFSELPNSEKTDRNDILSFKDGKNTLSIALTFARLLKKEIDENSCLSYYNTCLCVIPASTSEKNEKRFKSFIKIVSDIIGVENGYEYIKVKQDHFATKGDKSKNILPYLKFTNYQIQNKNILLVDDILTTGRSFSQCANQLINIGAKTVNGFFLGKTYSLIKDGSPNWYNSKYFKSTNQSQNTFDITFDLIQENMSIEEIAEYRGLTEETIVKHISTLSETYDMSYFDNLRPDNNTLEAVRNALKNVSEKNKLKPIYDFLNEEYSYLEIRLSLLFINNNDY